jgi:micrococcal nuclease
MIVVFLLGLFIVFYAYARANTIKINPDATYQITEVVDGDTIKVRIDRNIAVVRLLGVNTPETVDPRKPPECYGAEASRSMKEFLAGREVRLIQDIDREITDRYGRYLAYVYLVDGTAVNEWLLTNGLAREYTYGSPYDFQSRYKELENIARSAKKGLWGVCDM